MAGEIGKGKAITDWKSGETEFQWKEGQFKGKIEVFDKIMNEGEGDDAVQHIVFRSGNSIVHDDLAKYMKRIKGQKDINGDALQEYKKKEKERKRERQRQRNKEAKNPESALGIDVEEEVYDDPETAKKAKEAKKKDEVAEKDKEQKDHGERNEQRKQETPSSDPVISLLENQRNFIYHETKIPFKIPKSEIVNALRESFPDDDNINDKIKEVALKYFQSDEFFDFLSKEIDNYLDVKETKSKTESKDNKEENDESQDQS